MAWVRGVAWAACVAQRARRHVAARRCVTQQRIMVCAVCAVHVHVWRAHTVVLK